MSKSVVVTEAQRGFIGGTLEFVVTGIKDGKFTLAKDEQVLSVEGSLDGLKIADLVIVHDGAFKRKADFAPKTKKLNPPANFMAEYGM